MRTSLRPSRRMFARRRISRVRETPRRVAPRLTELDQLAVAGAMVFDCRPQVLPGAMDVISTELTKIQSITRASAATASPPEREQSFGGGGGLTGLISMSAHTPAHPPKYLVAAHPPEYIVAAHPSGYPAPAHPPGHPAPSHTPGFPALAHTRHNIS